jgi:hypothetical protein
MRVALTERDFLLLNRLKTGGFCTKEELFSVGFESNTSFRKRASLLAQAGLIESVCTRDLGGAPKSGDPRVSHMRNNLTLYRLTEKLRNTSPSATDLGREIMAYHQAGVSLIRARLEKEIEGLTVLTDPEIESELRAKGFTEHELLVPDLVLRRGTSNLDAALEFERTQKGEDRLILRLSKLNDRFSHVILVAETESLERFLLQRIRRFSRVAVAGFYDLKRVFHPVLGICSLQEFLDQRPL